jgi:outer membrane protein
MPGRRRTVLSAVVLLALCSCAAPYGGPSGPYVGPSQAPRARPRRQPAGVPMQFTVQEATLLALEGNRSFRVDRLSPQVSRTTEQEELAVFDPVTGATVLGGKEQSERYRSDVDAIEELEQIETGAQAYVTRTLPSGTAVTLDFSAQRAFVDGDYSRDDRHTARVGLTVSQALLRGRGREVNLARVEQARLDTRISEYELRAAAEALVAEVESTCWDYALAGRRVRIFTNSLDLARQQLAETEERIRVGKLPENERAAANAEVARRQEDLINARSEFEKTRLRLIRLVSPQGPDPWDREIVLTEEPVAPDLQTEPVADHAAVALRMRPDLNQARLSVQRGDVGLVQTRNGLLPRMDFFVQLGKTGYADSLAGALGDVEHDGYDVLAGVDFERPYRNRAARARHDRARLNRVQAVEALRNLEQTVQVDVRSAHVELIRAQEQVAATAATRALQQESLRAETEKLNLGKSTSFLVAQAQRDLVLSEIAEVEARVTLLKALVELYRLDGSLLARRGISAPGQLPPEP